MTVNGEHEPNVIMKDNDLKYKIQLPKPVAKRLMTQLENDANFLYSVGVMDYSLLVGVHNTHYDVRGGSDSSVASYAYDNQSSTNSSLSDASQLLAAVGSNGMRLSELGAESKRLEVRIRIDYYCNHGRVYQCGCVCLCCMSVFYVCVN